MARELPRADHPRPSLDDGSSPDLLCRPAPRSHPLSGVHAALHGAPPVMKSIGRCGQSLVEFALTIGLLMVLVVATAQVAIYLHYRNSIVLACREGGFEA